MDLEQKSKVAYRKIDPWQSVRIRPPVRRVLSLFLLPFHPHSTTRQDFFFGGGGTTK